MPADALWTFAMACNVYLTFFHKYDSEQLRQIEWKYLLFCYGLPLIPAFVYFFIKTEALGRVYGSAIVYLPLLPSPPPPLPFPIQFPRVLIISFTAMVLGLNTMGLAPNSHLLRPRLVSNNAHIRNLHPRRLSNIPKKAPISTSRELGLS